MKKENFMQDKLEIQIYAEVLERLILHLRKRTDVQNIDIMNLSGFCRNCLSKWYVNAAKNNGVDIDYEKAREIIYGIPYSEWKNKHQLEASQEKLNKFEKNKN